MRAIWTLIHIDRAYLAAKIGITHVLMTPALPQHHQIILEPL